MKGEDGRIIYVGKAIALRNRVRSYFQSQRGHDPKTRELVAHIVDFEVIRTDTATEALILENELIKRYLPKYNVMLKDSKTYPYLKITEEEWPRIISTRQILKDGGRCRILPLGAGEEGPPRYHRLTLIPMTRLVQLAHPDGRRVAFVRGAR